MSRECAIVALMITACGVPEYAGVGAMMEPTDASIAAADSAALVWDQTTRSVEDVSRQELASALQDLGYSTRQASAATEPLLARTNPDRLWRTKNHLYGYIAPRATGSSTQALRNAFDVEPDTSLNGRELRMTIDRIRVKKYPGRGTHSIAFFCNARTQLGRDVVPIEYSVGYLATEGDEVPVVGITMFEGLKIVGSYVNLACGTTNVDTKKDKTFFTILASNVFTQGLKLLDTMQPALQPLTELTRGVRKELEEQHKGLPVQKFEIGLDLSSISTRIKLSEGSYVVVQIPPEDVSSWNWADWEFEGGRIHRKGDSSGLVEYNYIVIGVSRV